jgi:hypothetical protein
MDHRMPTMLEPAGTSSVAPHKPAGDRALLSALVPGLGQIFQRRFMAAGIQFGAAATYTAGALGIGGRRLLLLALVWNLWSVLDAYRHDAD